MKRPLLVNPNPPIVLGKSPTGYLLVLTCTSEPRAMRIARRTAGAIIRIVRPYGTNSIRYEVLERE